MRRNNVPIHNRTNQSSRTFVISSPICPVGEPGGVRLLGFLREKENSYLDLKGKVKGSFMGLFKTAAVRPTVFLPLTSSRIHPQRRHASYRCARALPAKAGTITSKFC